MCSKFPDRKNFDQRSGMSLAEVVFAMLILAIMAIGGGAYLYFARTENHAQRNRRVALELANGRLEEMRGVDYLEIRPLGLDYDWHYISRQGASWVHGDTNPEEKIVVNGVDYPMRTTVRFRDADGGLSSYDYIQVQVRVMYRVRGLEEVKLETCFAR